MNIFEAYRLGKQLSRELTEKKLDKEMYMAVNMMGHIYNYSGNKEAAKQCFWDVIHRMEKEGYKESMPPIYMNLVNITMNEDPQEAMKLIDKALELAGESSPDRVFDIETRRTLGYLALGDTANFVKGYKAYKEGVAKGFNGSLPTDRLTKPSNLPQMLSIILTRLRPRFTPRPVVGRKPSTP